MNKRKIFTQSLAFLLSMFILMGCSTNKSDIENDDNTGLQETDNATEEMNETENSTAEIMETDENNNQENEQEEQNSMKMTMQIGENTFTATLANNSSAEALVEMLQEGPVTIDMKDYENMEKVGGLGKNLPTNDESITTEAGDLILYMGNAFVIYYAPNSWNFTRLGKIDNVTQEELKAALGSGDVSVTLSLD